MHRKLRALCLPYSKLPQASAPACTREEEGCACERERRRDAHARERGGVHTVSERVGGKHAVAAGACYGSRSMLC